MAGKAWLAAASLAGVLGGVLGCAEADHGPKASPETAPPREPPPATAPRVHPAIGSLSALPAAERRAFHHHEDFSALGEPQPGEWRDRFAELGQSVAQFEGGPRVTPTAERRTIHVQPIGRFPSDASPPLDVVADYVERFFGLDVVVLRALPLHALGAVPRRRHGGVEQLLAPGLLYALQESLPADSYGLIGVTMSDLYPEPGWNYVFGLATFDKRVGVHSFARYDPSFFGEPRTQATRGKMLERALKVMAHELGHMFGLAHCTHYRCLMNGSNSLQETDRSPMHLCPVCLRKLHIAAGIAPLARYRRLYAFYREQALRAEAQWTARRIAYLEHPAGPGRQSP